MFTTFVIIVYFLFKKKEEYVEGNVDCCETGRRSGCGGFALLIVLFILLIIIGCACWGGGYGGYGGYGC
ncbi:TPA: YjcZ family sporulation protein [Bacillus pseudomycoides]|nr:YjcZ family sporulation protein [Bacillus pseudomycoides]